MTHSVSFTNHRRDGDQVVKMLTTLHPAYERLATVARDKGRSGLQHYLDVLRAYEVALPTDLIVVSENPPTVRHGWIEGPTLAELAVQQPQHFVAAIARVARWVHVLGSTDARIDTNLANFCLTPGGPVLVDVLPPLRPSWMPAPPHTLFETLFYALCFDTEIILDALIGYAARALLRADPPTQARRALADLGRGVRLSLTVSTTGAFPACWFRARARLALRALDGELPIAVLHDFFATTSVLAFRQLDEVRRKRRLDRVAALKTSLGLA